MEGYFKETSYRILIFILLTLFLHLFCKQSIAQPVQCLSPDPADWPPSAKPYFLIIADTSGSMTACTNPVTAYPESCGFSSVPNSCSLIPTRYNDLKCALQKTITAYAGQANFGLMTFSVVIDSCQTECTYQCNYSGYPNTCTSESYGCTISCTDAESSVNGTCTGCGPMTGDASTRAGGILRVPISPDNYWEAPPDSSNAQDILGWVDNTCAGDRELFASGATPLNGSLRDAKRYLESGWTHPDNPSISYPSPLGANDPACRDINVILITDGDETCDTQTDAINAADALFSEGITIDSNVYNVQTYVINFAGGTQANTDAIAAAGGTGFSSYVENEVELSQAISAIISTEDNELCDNEDNNCNGCIDEGFIHYTNVGQTCVSWSSNNEREAWIADYKDSIASNPPDGDRTKLPCTTLVQQSDPSLWLCYDPGEQCDAQDNNGQSGVDENTVRCGEPPHCPTTEVCNGLDDDCDGFIDEDNVCGGCIPSPEICDGCDNDCDGIADNGVFPSVSCGKVAPENCVGTRVCKAPQVVSPGQCAQDGGYDPCSYNPQSEICDSIDNNCNGIIDEDIPPVACEAQGTSPGLIYGETSQCVKGIQYCGQSCTGFVGPTAEVSDGVDNDCNGTVDDIPMSLLEVVATGGGKVTSQPVGVDCPVDCLQLFPTGTSLILSPAPSEGWSFQGWGGGCSGLGSCDVLMDEDTSVAATFEIESYLLNINLEGDGFGTVTSSPAGIDCGDVCAAAHDYNTDIVLTATAGIDSEFVGWTGACSGSGKTCVIKMDQALTVGAIFNEEFPWVIFLPAITNGRRIQLE